ncbi:MAG: 30S ribosomal protein S20 [Candidatus Spechtbacterales bacterium]
MPNLQNAKKALRQNKKRADLNRNYKNRVKKVSREIQDLLKEGKQKEAQELMPTFYKAVDKAAKKGVLHKNTASRRKAVVAKKVSPAPEKK